MADDNNKKTLKPEQAIDSIKTEGTTPVVTSPPRRNSNPGSGSVGNKERRGRDSGHQKRGGNTPGGKDKSAVAEGPGGSKSGQGGSAKKTGKNKYGVKKRPPPRDFNIKPNDVFVNEKSHFVAQLSKCKKLFDKGYREIHLHGLGKAIPRAINIAFELKKFYHDTVDYSVNTSTLQTFDDIVDLEDPEQAPTARARNVSSVDIKVYRSINIP